MLLSLTDSIRSSGASAIPSVDQVGGKAASLAKLYSTPELSQHVPRAFALSVDFFRPWIDTIASTKEFSEAKSVIESAANGSNGGGGGGDTTSEAITRCTVLKELCRTISLSSDQRAILTELQSEVKSWPIGLAAVRSSAPEEDGTGASFAGAFETKLGVTSDTLEDAVRTCFASMFDYRVFCYTSARTDADVNNSMAFAAVVMEMVDSDTAGVALSANPLNSDRDEMVVDSSWGLGESVVDGSIHADRYVYCKISDKIIERTIGNKTQEKRLNGSGGVDTRSVDEKRQKVYSLTDEQLKQLARLVCLVEKTYGIPIDVEWAYAPGAGGEPALKLLQARPITALFYLDDKMMTKPGERRVLYYDFNIASEATTTTPFTHMDISLYSRMASAMYGIEDWSFFPYDPRMPMFNASTRQYANLSIFFKFLGPNYFCKNLEFLDPYIASIFAGSDCDRKKYRIKKLPKEVSMRNAWWIFRHIPVKKIFKIGQKFKKDPEEAKEKYIQIVECDMRKVKQLEARGMDKSDGLQSYANELFRVVIPSIFQELGAIYFVILSMFNKLDAKRREGKTEEIRSEYDALCGGYEGDELMEMNIEMHRLATRLPDSIWDQYDHEDLHELADRVKDNLDGKISDLPQNFLDEWKTFMGHFGFDGKDQLFLSSPRYADSPVILLGKLRQNVGVGVKDPAITQQEQVAKRRHVMKLHEQRAKAKRYVNPLALSKVRKRNLYLDHLMWMRNAPKLHIAYIFGVLRAEVLRIQDNMLAEGRLEKEGDIFHLDLAEVDMALRDDSFDAMEIIRPRKIIHERAMRATICPLLIDSRCRILKPDPPVVKEDREEGSLIGAAVSPGVASGRVRIINSPDERFETGEVLATVVTGPAWTPLFVGASAVVLQIGGVLQHGALCAREYGKPAVSNIDVHAELKTGMMVEVDGNTGVVKILEDVE